jgi:hypothetical protein
MHNCNLFKSWRYIYTYVYCCLYVSTCQILGYQEHVVQVQYESSGFDDVMAYSERVASMIGHEYSSHKQQVI